MMSLGQYELLDFGQNEKLESFAGTIVRRETPSAPGRRQQESGWETYDLRGRPGGSEYCWQGDVPVPWWMDTGNFRLELRTTPTGQLGVFPEQAINWQWIQDASINLDGLKAINLFGYTGATTMALANRGAEVVHLDAAKSVVNWARSNAKASNLESAPIRWIVEDAMTFVHREIKRGNVYDIVVADPPSFGRGPNGELWKIQHDLELLIDSLAELTAGNCRMILLSCHTPGIDHASIGKLAESAFDLRGGKGASESFELSIASSGGKRLSGGNCFRWMGQSANRNLESKLD